MSFPKQFVWGAASAAYQVEGAARKDGKGPSVWDAFCRKEGAVWNRQSGDIACDHYRRYRDDVKMMANMGLKAYRFSVSWPRVLPNGVGKINARGLSFYDKLVDQLLAAKITPWITLFHWDLPLALYHRGGWLNADIPNWFADYTRVVVEKLSDRVQNWITLNEPQVFIALGYHEGRHAPGDKLPFKKVLQIGHHSLLAHGRAVQVIRQHSILPPQIGYAPFAALSYPASNSAADIRAARQDLFSVTAPHCWNNTWWMDPVFKGHYPEDGLKLFGKDAPRFTDAEMKIISQPVDFFGVNMYTGNKVRAGKSGKPERLPQPVGHDLTAFRWAVTPQVMHWGTKFYWERYRHPIVVTENGMSNIDWVSLDGRVHDPQRIDFTRRYLLALEQAMKSGADVRAYFHWSIMDNFEWAEGYKERFGLVHVDYNTQKRIPKDSALWYKKVIATNGKHLRKQS